MTTPAAVTAALRDCRTLADADAALLSLEPSTARRWGLWDGWAGRHRTTAGLVPNGWVPDEVRTEYLVACDEGRRLRDGAKGGGK